MATHYQTLGVPDDATTAEIRRAYLARARTLHPDRLVDATPAETARAERSMQEVNGAWSVLGDSARRYEYDLSLTGHSSATRSTAHVPKAAVEDRSADVVSSIVHGMPWFLLMGVMAVIFVFTAYAAGNGGDDPPEGPAVIGADVNSCFVFVGGATLPVSCESPNDGVVTGKVALGSAGCAPTATSIYLTDERMVLCYRVP